MNACWMFRQWLVSLKHSQLALKKKKRNKVIPFFFAFYMFFCFFFFYVLQRETFRGFRFPRYGKFATTQQHCVIEYRPREAIACPMASSNVNGILSFFFFNYFYCLEQVD